MLKSREFKIFTKKELLELGYKYYYDTGQIPAAKKFSKKAGYCSRDWIRKKFGSWNNYLVELDFTCNNQQLTYKILKTIKEITSILKTINFFPTIQKNIGIKVPVKKIRKSFRYKVIEQVDHLYLEKICKKLNIDSAQTIMSFRGCKNINYQEFVHLLIKFSTLQEVSKELGISYSRIHALALTLGLKKSNNSSYRLRLLALIGKKWCGKCNKIKNYSDFYINKDNTLITYCKDCKSVAWKNWYENNKEKHIQKVIARNRNLDKKLTTEEVIFLFNKFNSKCIKCGYTNEQHLIDFGQRLHIDHIQPLSKKGITSLNNLQLLCRSCNSKKGIRYNN